MPSLPTRRTHSSHAPHGSRKHKPARAPPSSRRCPSPRGSPPPFPGRTPELTAEGFHGLHAARTRATCAMRASLSTITSLPATPVQLCHLPRPSGAPSAAHEPHHAAHGKTFKSHARRTSNPSPKAPGSGACPRPSRPPPLSPKHSQWKPLNFSPLLPMFSDYSSSTFGYVHELLEILYSNSTIYRRSHTLHLVFAGPA